LSKQMICSDPFYTLHGTASIILLFALPTDSTKFLSRLRTPSTVPCRISCPQYHTQ
jgi:hypothetical protein